MKPEIVMAMVTVGSICLTAGALTHKIFFAGSKTASLVTGALNDNLKSLETILAGMRHDNKNMMTKVDNHHKSLKELHLINHDQTMDLNIIKDSGNALHRRWDGFKVKQQAHMLNTEHNHKEILGKIKEK